VYLVKDIYKKEEDQLVRLEKKGSYALYYFLPKGVTVEYKGLDDDYRKYWYLTADDVTWYRVVENSTTEHEVEEMIKKLEIEAVKPDFIVNA